jgi:Uma2 family endonuclease
VPVLEAGDRMTREEFHRIYEMSPRLKHVELVEGVVYVPSPIRVERHGEAQMAVLGWLAAYVARHPEVGASGPATVLLDRDNEPEPDAVMWRRSGGAARVNDDDYLEGAPELVVEIAASSRSIDLGDKLRAYRRNGVQEYIVWVTGESRLLWFALQDGDYVELPSDDRGVIESRVFPGLRLDVPAILRFDVAAVLAEQTRGSGPQPPAVSQ